MQKDMHAMLVLRKGIVSDSKVSQRICFDACSHFDVFIYDLVVVGCSSKHRTSNWPVWSNGMLYA